MYDRAVTALEGHNTGLPAQSVNEQNIWVGIGGGPCWLPFFFFFFVDSMLAYLTLTIFIQLARHELDNEMHFGILVCN